MSRSSLARQQQKKQKGMRKLARRRQGAICEARDLITWMLQFPEVEQRLRGLEPADVDVLLYEVTVDLMLARDPRAPEALRRLQQAFPGQLTWAAEGFALVLGDQLGRAWERFDRLEGPHREGTCTIRHELCRRCAPLEPWHVYLQERILLARDLAELEYVAQECAARWGLDATVSHLVATARFQYGRVQDALELARDAHGRDPDNADLLRLLVRICVLAGRSEEAEHWGQEVRRLQGSSPFAVAVALHVLGDDQGVLDALAQLGEVGDDMVYCLAGAALGRLERWEEAREQWRGALELDPHCTLASGNLENAELPPEERFSPWAFERPFWVPPHLEGFHELANPGFKSVLAVWLDRADPETVRGSFGIAMRLADYGQSDPLRGFAERAHGPATLRQLARERLGRP